MNVVSISDVYSNDTRILMSVQLVFIYFSYKLLFRQTKSRTDETTAFACRTFSFRTIDVSLFRNRNKYKFSTKNTHTRADKRINRVLKSKPFSAGVGNYK